jgi:hypothetical protein
LPEQTDRWSSQLKRKSAVKAVGSLAAFCGATTATGLAAIRLAHTPIGTLLVVFGAALISEALAFAGWALLDWLNGRMLLQLLKEVKPGGKVSTPSFEIDYTGVVAGGSPQVVNSEAGPLEAVK